MEIIIIYIQNDNTANPEREKSLVFDKIVKYYGLRNITNIRNSYVSINMEPTEEEIKSFQEPLKHGSLIYASADSINGILK